MDEMVMPPRSSFARYWTAAVINSFGSAVSAVALPVLVVQHLRATPGEVGLVNAAQFVPYALVGLVAGVYLDRRRRRPALVVASVGRALALGAIPVLWILGALQIWTLVVAMLLFGTFSVFGFAATQSLLPRLVPPGRLVAANARLDQTDAAAQTVGPGIGGALVGLVGAPAAIAVDALSYLVDAVVTAGIRVEEPRPVARPRRFREELRAGVSGTYRDRTLGPLAVSTHLWFLGNGAAWTILSLLALRSLGFSAIGFGLLMAASGVAGVVGAAVAAWTGGRIGSGRTVVIARVAYPVAWLLVAFSAATPAARPPVFVALVLHGLAGGVENANEMGLWQSRTPDALLGRVNATRRSVNRIMAALGALAGGSTAGLFGLFPTVVGVVVLFAVAALVAVRSPLRSGSTG